jgi:hypothetical protein
VKVVVIAEISGRKYIIKCCETKPRSARAQESAKGAEQPPDLLETDSRQAESTCGFARVSPKAKPEMGKKLDQRRSACRLPEL